MSGIAFSSYVALWVIVVFQCAVLFAVLRQIELVRRSVQRSGFSTADGLPYGADAPSLSGTDFRNGRVVDSSALRGSGGALLFLAAGCSICRRLAATSDDVVRAFQSSLVVICQGSENSCRRLLAQLDSGIAALVDDGSMAGRYRIDSYPTLVLVGPNHDVRGYHHPETDADLRRLLVRLADEPTTASESAPALSA